MHTAYNRPNAVGIGEDRIIDAQAMQIQPPKIHYAERKGYAEQRR
jgi:hypothetical protein